MLIEILYSAWQLECEQPKSILVIGVFATGIGLDFNSRAYLKTIHVPLGIMILLFTTICMLLNMVR
jgi:hypothetical protein